MTKLMSLFKSRNKKIKENVKGCTISIASERFSFFLFFLLLLVHLIACLWIVITQFHSERNWLLMKLLNLQENGESEMRIRDKYFLSLNFVTQTITTVGYGDINSVNTVERIVNILLMITGVLGFSFASGSIGSIMLN